MQQDTCRIDGCDSPAKSRQYCTKHYARGLRLGTLEDWLLVCEGCEVTFVSKGKRRYCSTRCQPSYARQGRSYEYQKQPCPSCGEPMWPSRGRADGKPSICNPCRRASHGTAGYYRGCRCDICRAAINEKQKRYAAAYRERTGKSLRGMYREADGKRYYFTAKTRAAVYERDGWVCQLCFEPIDPLAPPNTSESASIDHIECQTWALIPDHSLANLRMAHFGCNARRGNGARRENAINGRSPGSRRVG